MMQVISYILIYLFLFYILIWFANFLTTFYFRIPRGIPLNGFQCPPMCSSCKVKLKWPQYAPFYNLIKGIKMCKSCGSPIPKDYFIIEAVASLLFIFNALLKPFNYNLMLDTLALWGLFLNLLLAIKYRTLFVKAVFTFFFIGVVYYVFGNFVNLLTSIKDLVTIITVSLFNMAFLKKCIKFNDYDDTRLYLVLFAIPALIFKVNLWIMWLLIFDLAMYIQVKKFPNYNYKAAIFCGIIILATLIRGCRF